MTNETQKQPEITMNNLLERVGMAIRGVSDQYNAPPWEINWQVLGQAAISAICDEIDEGGLIAAAHAHAEQQDIDIKYVGMKQLRTVIQSYLSHLKSTTETKE